MFLNLKGSKSIINRLLCLALYHNIELTVSNVNLCNDVQEILNIYNQINKKYLIKDDSLHISKDTNKPDNISIMIYESGTCLRFVLPYLCFAGFDLVKIQLGKRLSLRPLQPLIDCLIDCGALISFSNNEIRINKAALQSKHIVIDSSQSSQFLSSLLMLASSVNGKFTIQTKNKIASKSYIKSTIDLLNYFEIDVSPENDEFHVFGKNITRKTEFDCDPDYSSACYVWLYSALNNKQITVKQAKNIYQADYGFLKILAMIGFNTVFDNDLLYLNSQTIKAPQHYHFNMENMPDQIITLAFLSLFSNFSVSISGCETLALKESDRITGILANIKLLGGQASFANNTLSVKPLLNKPLKVKLLTFNDHRFAMTFVVLKKIYPYLEIDNTDCIAKSYPEFINIMKLEH